MVCLALLAPAATAASRYTTHVPVYDLTAAAGFWGPESVPEEIGWTEVPGVSLKPGMVVARVTGPAMEPLRRYRVADSETFSTWTQPTLSGNRIFIKDLTSLAVWVAD